jgi:subtilase family serine protease
MKRFLSLSSILATLTFGTLLVPVAFGQQRPHIAGPAALDQQVEFNVFLPLRHKDELDQLLRDQHTRGSENYHKWLTPAQFRSRFGADPEDMKAASEILSAYGLSVTAAHSHGLRVRGPVASVQHVFNISMSNAVTQRGHLRPVTTEPLNLPAALQRMGAQVLHFANLPEARSQARRAAGPITLQNRYSPFGSYWFDDLKQAYDFPSYRRLNGQGRTIAIMSGSDYLESDIKAYFAHESKPGAPIAPPKIVRLPIHGGSPFDPNSGNSFEAELDLEQAGGMAPGATLLLVNLPDGTFASTIDGYLTVVDNNLADIVSSSFTFGTEQLYDAAYNDGIDFFPTLQVADDVFKQGNAEGITFVESSGDSGGLPTPPLAYFTTPPQNSPVVVGHFLPGVEVFNSSPHVTSVGGTNLRTTFDPPSLESRYVRENAFADPEVPYDPYGVGNLLSGGVFGSGGGISIFYGKPPYQRFIETGSKMRTVPDISLQMGGCPAGLAKLPCRTTDSSTVEFFAGQLVGVIGTSVSAPDFAGILALKEQHLGGSRLGNVNYDIYAAAALQPALANSPLDLLHQGQPGNNGAFSTTPTGYNYVLGVGTPLVRNFIFAPLLPPARNPQTPSNP